MYRLIKIMELKNEREKEKVKVIGKVVDVNFIPYKNGNGELVKVTINDKEDSVTCVYFLNKNPEDQYRQIKEKFMNLKEKKDTTGVIIEGEVKVDEKYHRIKVTSIGVNAISPITQISIHKLTPFEIEKRIDEEEEKRVEFQVISKSTTQQSIVDVKELIDLVSENRFKQMVVALTDRATVSAFPAFEKEAKAKKVKAIYGAEFKVSFESLTPIINGTPSNKNISDLELVFFDLETTGLYPVFDEIIEFGAVKVKNGKVIEEFQAFVKPTKNISEFITKLTGITNEMVEDAESELSVLKKFKEFVGEGILVGHNVEFDYSFIQQKCKKYKTNFNFNQNLVVDTIKLARFLFENLSQMKQKSYKLDRLLNFYGKKIEEHHRAKEDACSTYQLFNLLMNGKEKNKENEKGVYDYGFLSFSDIQKKATEIPDTRSWSKVLVYAKNQKGLNSLYKLITLANTKYVDNKTIPFFEIEKRKENLIVVSAGFQAEDIYSNLLKGKVKKDEWKKYDAIGIHSSNQNYNFKGLSKEQLDEINKLVVKIANDNDVSVIALGNVHYLHEFEEKYHKVVINEAKRNFNPIIERDNKPNAFFRTTNEMLAEFSYLGEVLSKEVVIYNTQKLAAKIEEIEIIPSKLYTPYIEGADEKLKELVWERVKELFGDTPPSLIKERLEYELEKILNGGYGVIYYATHLIVKRSIDAGFLVGSRGSVGSSLVATYTDITEVNPLPPHYYCKVCKKVEWREDVESGNDLPIIPCECGGEKHGEGHGIPFEMFMGFDGDKTPDIDLNFSGEFYQLKAHEHAREIFGHENVYRAGTIGTYADGKSDKAIWDYYKSLGKKETFPLEELYNDTKNFYHFDKKSGSYKKRAYIYGTQNKIHLEELKEKVKKGKKIKEVERTSFDIKDSYFTEIRRYLNDVKYSTGQHAGGLMVIPQNMDVEDFFPLSYAGDGKEKKVITTHMDYKPYENSLLKMDLLGQDDPTRLYLLEKETGVKAVDVPYYDEQVIEEFRKGCTERISEFNTPFSTQVTVETKPYCFSDLVRISGLTHGTGVWINNADKLIKEGKSIREVIACREDMLNFLKSNGIEHNIAFNIVEKVRKGKSITTEEENMLLSKGVPQWYIDSMKVIEYLFPKAHATAYVRNAFRLAWYKKYYLLQFTKVLLDMQMSGNKVDFLPTLKPYEEFKEFFSEIDKKMKDPKEKYKLTNKEKDSYADYQLILYFKKNGYEILPVDLNFSDIDKFIYEGDKAIRMPLSAIPDLNKTHKEKILSLRKNEEEINLEIIQKKVTTSEKIITNIKAYCGLN
ncbi:exonuclease domain-containing protein [Bacillus badius]|uniref:exonuclease domain-containing protein n=1 Tax=Bacillus badius TaxID=1455 RepID=UPI0007B36D50|nr:exonuclease domain-containing protein [Bacillus badius]KZR59346.1 hypothetical protein A3781_13170 [Bacillus badius]